MPRFLKHSRVTGSRSVLQKVGDEADSIGGSSWSEDLGKGMRLDLGELVFHVLFKRAPASPVSEELDIS